MSSETEVKQNYLYDEIIAQEYDADSFMGYMAEAREDGTNIDIWTIGELQQIVQHYKATFAHDGSSLADQYQEPAQSDDAYPQQTFMQQYESEYQQPPQQQQIQSQYQEVDEDPFASIQKVQTSALPVNSTQFQQSSLEVTLQQQQSLQQNQQQQKQQQVQGFALDPSALPFDESLAKLRRKDEFGFENASFSQTSQNTQFKNNDIWSIPQQAPLAPANDIWGIPQTAAITVKSGSSADPFSVFQSTSPQKPQQSVTSDPFSGFYAPQQTAAQVKPQAPRKDVDFDILFTGAAVGASTAAFTVGQTQLPKSATSSPTKATEQVNKPVSATIQTQIKQQQQQQQLPQTAQKQVPVTTTQPQQFVANASNNQPKKEQSPQEMKQGEEKFLKEKPCKKAVQTVIGAKEIVRSSITDHQTAQGSLFGIGGSIVIYSVRTQPFNWEVKRKHNDFLWLRTLLIKMYPGAIVPPLPSNTISSLDENLIQRRKNSLESFLSEVLSHKELRNSKFLTDFLSISDEKIFKQRVKEIEKLNKPKNLTEVETITGKITLNRNPDASSQSQRFSEYLDQNDIQYEKLKKLSKQLIEGYNNVGNTLHQIGDTFAQLFSNVQTLNTQSIPSVQTKKLENTYKVMNNMCVMQANSFADQIKIFQNHFYNFFKFHKDNLSGFKEIVKTRNELNAALQKKDANEGSGISAIFRSSKETVYSPSRILKELDEQVAYYNDQMMAGGRVLLDNRAKTYSEHFTTFCHLQKSIITEMGIVWQEISEHFKVVASGLPNTKKLEILKKVS